MDDAFNWEIEVSADNHFPRDLDWGEEWFLTPVEEALRVLGLGGEAVNVSVRFTGDDAVRKLNLCYRGLDETTDVLAFSADFPGYWEGEHLPPSNVVHLVELPEGPDGEPDGIGAFQFVTPPGLPQPLGEVIISVPQARRQAVEKGHGLREEMALLVVHGVLHLAGHDHYEEAETELMQSLEKAALERVFPTSSPSQCGASAR